jgi:hypothetical protein
MKVNGVKYLEDYAVEVTRLTQERYPQYKITEGLTRQVLRIYQDNLKRAIIERAGTPPKNIQSLASKDKVPY